MNSHATSTIPNEYPEGMTKPDQYQLPDLPHSMDMEISFLSSTDLKEIEEGVYKLNAGIDVLALVQGLAILKIEREALFVQAGYKSSAQYYREADARLNMPKQTVSHRRQTAEAYLRFRKKLGKTNLSGHISKLKFLPRAADVHGDEDAIKNFKSMSAREFIEYANQERKKPVMELPAITASVNRGRLLIDGKAVVSIADELEDDEKSFVVDLLKDAYQARKGGLLPHIVPVYDKGEARAVDNFLKKYRSEK